MQASEKKEVGNKKGAENWRFPMDPTNVPVKYKKKIESMGSIQDTLNRKLKKVKDTDLA